MPAPKFDRERASSILAEAHFAKEDKEVLARWGISKETLRRYRLKLLEDSKLCHLVALKKAALRQTWETERDEFLKRGFRKLWETIEQLDPTAQNVQAIATALDIAMGNTIVTQYMELRAKGNSRTENQTGAKQMRVS